jgi:hypothetical protein
MPRPALVRRALAAAVAPLALSSLALSSLAACGTDDGARAQDSSSAAQDAPDTPEEGATLAPADFADLVRDSFEKITTAHTTTRSEVMGGSMNGEGDLDYTGDSPAAAMTMSGDILGPTDMEVRMVDEVMYLNMGAMTQGKFARIDLKDPDNPMGSFAESMDPSRAMDALESALEKVTYEGNDDTGDHYVATADTATLLKGMGQNVPSGAGLPDTLSYDVWFDDEGRFTRMDMDMGTLGKTEMRLTDFGTDVDVEAPPADQITTKGLRMAG